MNSAVRCLLLFFDGAQNAIIHSTAELGTQGLQPEFIIARRVDELDGILSRESLDLLIVHESAGAGTIESAVASCRKHGLPATVIGDHYHSSKAEEYAQIRAADYLFGPPVEAIACAVWRANRNRANRATRMLNSRLQAQLLTHARESIFVTDTSGIVQYVNEAFSQQTGFDADEVVGRHLELLDSGYESGKFWPQLWHALAKGTSWKGRLHARRKDGTLLHWDLSMVPVFHDGMPLYLGFSCDNEIEENLREQLHDAQRMEALGQLASGIAHDFNNLLTTIIGVGFLLREDFPADSQWRSDLDEMVEAAERGSHLTKQLLAFSGRRQLEPQIVDLNALVLSLQKLVNRTIGENIELYSIHNITEATTLADPGQVEQTIMNLVVNARDAMPDGGSLRMLIEKRFVEGDEADSMRMSEGDYVILAITDSGTGIPPEVQDHIFIPYFTTKESGRGTGLGLPTTLAIMQRLGGGIRFETAPNQGTTFSLYFPYVPGVLAEREEENETQAEAGTETILLVEDEITVRELSVRVLKRLGYNVIEAFDGEHGLEMSRAYKGRFEMLVTDVTMPRMNGKQLAMLLREENPNLPVLYICGYSNSALLNAGEVAADVLQKPFTPAELAAKVRELLDASKQ